MATKKEIIKAYKDIINYLKKDPYWETEKGKRSLEIARTHEDPRQKRSNEFKWR